MNTGPAAGRPGNLADARDYRVIDEVRSYEQAEHEIDTLSDAGFPVENTRIVGVNLEQVEQVTGRLSVAKAAASSALGGASFGLFVSLFFLLFTPSISYWHVLLFGVLAGAIFGAVYGAIVQAMQSGRRDFASVRSLVPNSYEIQVRSQHVNESIAILQEAGILAV